MTFSTESFKRQAGELLAYDGADLGALPRQEFATLREKVGRAKRSFDALVAEIAAEAASRSSDELGWAGMARKEGHRRPEGMIAQDLGITPGEAGKIIDVGRTLQNADAPVPAPDESGAGRDVEPPAPRHHHVAAAVRAGEISVDAARAITEALDSIDPAEPQAGDLDGLEQGLVAQARRLTVPQLRKACRREVARRSPRDLEKTERRLHQERFLSFSDDPAGMVIMHGKLDPLTAAPIKAWIEAQVRAALHKSRDGSLDGDGVEGGAGIADDRSPGQIAVDAPAMLATHGLDCEQPTAGVKAQIVMRVDAEDLESGVGVGECDQLSGPISVATLRAMAVDAAIIPVVMGSGSLPLDVGRASRLFTPAQRIALLERDGGCSWCHAPPSFCEAHHVRWWHRDSGRSDLRNGVMLCTACHHRMHHQDWRIEVRGDDVWFTPPASVDPHRTPRIGGKAHLDGGYVTAA
ncbi:DUF222 domain-containing protein [uncultured Demequina sp.]|uniref:DUF222 domain-containing protein n=1 Tax=uncultured Demequina sp. TaxID=693499 RepID=UPI0025D11CB1|nr:DUF222 domain-containing protein [uncultured Demequina sp.]